MMKIKGYDNLEYAWNHVPHATLAPWLELKKSVKIFSFSSDFTVWLMSLHNWIKWVLFPWQKQQACYKLYQPVPNNTPLHTLHSIYTENI